MAENNTKPDPDGERRRRLIKGAVAAGVGVAAYSAPTISAIPAYAQQSPALGSIDNKTGVQRVWYSPNKNNACGQWVNISASGTFIANKGSFGVAPFAQVTYNGIVPGNQSKVGFVGNPNNGTTDVNDSSTGCGNVQISFTSSGSGSCEMVIYGTGCSKNGAIGGGGEGTTAGTTAAALSTTLQSGGVLNYCTNQPGAICGPDKGSSTKGNNRCFASFTYEVRCTVN